MGQCPVHRPNQSSAHKLEGAELSCRPDGVLGYTRAIRVMTLGLPLVMDEGSYSAFPLGRMFPVVILAMLALLDLVTLIAGGSPWIFNLLFAVGLLYGGYWFVWLV
jgi:hypothetical protein